MHVDFSYRCVCGAPLETAAEREFGECLACLAADGNPHVATGGPVVAEVADRDPELRPVEWDEDDPVEMDRP